MIMQLFITTCYVRVQKIKGLFYIKNTSTLLGMILLDIISIDIFWFIN